MKKLFFFNFIFLIILAGIVLAVPLSETTGTISPIDPLQGTVELPGTVSQPEAAAAAAAAGGGGGGGAAGGAAAPVVTVTDLEEKLDFESTSGFTTDSAQGSEFSFKDSKGDKHTLTITKVYVDRILITINSPGPITITIKIGETKELDVNNDGVKDIAIKLVAIIYGKAKLTFRKLAEKVEKPAEELPEEVVPAEELPEEEVKPEVKPPEVKKIPYQQFIVIAVIIILAIIIYLVMKKKKTAPIF